MSSANPDNIARIETNDSQWKNLYRIAGIAAIITAVFIPIQIVVFLTSPPPATVEGWFSLFQRSPFLGLLDMDLLLVMDNILGIPLFIALYMALRQASKSVMTIATGAGLVALATYFASNTAFNMLTLSDGFAAAPSETQKSAFIAAGQGMLANYTGTAFQLSYVVGAIVLIMISVVMLRSKIFGKLTAWLGIVGNVIALGLYVPSVGVYISVFSVLFLWVWYILVARRLFQLAGTTNDIAAVRRSHPASSMGG